MYLRKSEVIEIFGSIGEPPLPSPRTDRWRKIIDEIRRQDSPPNRDGSPLYYNVDLIVHSNGEWQLWSDTVEVSIYENGEYPEEGEEQEYITHFDYEDSMNSVATDQHLVFEKMDKIYSFFDEDECDELREFIASKLRGVTTLGITKDGYLYIKNHY